MIGKYFVTANAVNFLDSLQTFIGLRTGLQETNPIMLYLITNLGLILTLSLKVLIIGAVSFFCCKKISDKLAIPTILIISATVITNFMLLSGW